MKKLNFFKRGITSFIVLAIFLFVGTEIFLGQSTPQKFNENIFNYDENDPYIDRPTREALSHVVEKSDDDMDIITDANGFDNFEIGVDFAEQMLVSNPTNPLNMQFGVNNSATGQNAYYTTDGYTWTQSNPAYHASICCDPWSAWDGLGRLVYGSGVNGQYTYRSTTGASYLAPILSVSGNDRNTLAAEQTNSGPNPNYFYGAITPGNFARSLDGGANWATTYTPSNTIPGVMIAVGPNGVDNGDCIIYVTNTGSTAAVTYTFHRSLDGGATFAVRSSLTTAGYVGTLNSAGRLVINHGRTRPYPMIAMDNSNGPFRGRLYLVYASNVPAGNGNKPDIRLRYSDDQALTWSAAVTVNDNANPSLSDQWFPAIWCEKTTGRLYIKWYDTRDNPAGYGVHVLATYTDDGGATFATNQRLTNAIWTYPNPACPPNTNCYRGDYDGMTANPKAGFAVWYDGRIGTYKNVGAYFPDFGMLATPASDTIHQTNSSVNYLINIPAVKLYTDVTTFSATISPNPSPGSITMEFLGGNTLSSYPNTKYMKVRTVGTVLGGPYTITITGEGSNGTPVHKRTVLLVNIYDSVRATNIYTLGNIPFPWGLSDSLVDRPFNENPTALFRSFKTGIRLKKIVPGARGVQLRVRLRNREAPFHTRFDSTYQFSINTIDSVVIVRLPGFNEPRRDLVIVQALPGEADEMDFVAASDSLVYCVDFTSDSYNHADPCLSDTNGTGFNGSTGNLVAGFSNDDASSFPVYAVDYSFYDSTAGNKPYKIVIYGDDGSGKPGALLYISPPLTSPPGISAPRPVTHEINPPVIIPGYSKFFVGYKQTSTANIKASYQNEIPIREKSFFFSTPEASAVWFDFSDSSKNFRLDISPRTSLRLFLKAYLEGFYNGVTMIPDTANVVVRNFNSPYGLIEQDAAILNSGGMGIFDFRKLNRSTGYYFIVRHRNHIETWSHNIPERFDVFDKSYNFTDSISKAYGNNMKNILGKFVLYSGDVNQDGTVDATDLALIDNDAANFATGYLNTDLTGDNQVDGADLAIADNNAANFVSVIRP